MKHLSIAGLLPSLLLAAFLIAGSHSATTPDQGPTVHMTVEPIR